MKNSKFMKTYMPFAINTFKAELVYKGNTIMFFCGQGILIAVTYFLWKAIYSSSSESIMEGFSFNQMIIYMFISFLTNLLVSTDVTSNIYREVKDGSIAYNLIKPINYCFRMMFQSLGAILFNFIIVFVAAFIVVTTLFYRMEGSINIINILLYFVSVILGMVISFFYNYCFGLLSFKITNMWGLSQVMHAIFRLLSGALIPLTFFPGVFQKIIQYAPFGSIISAPTMIYLGKLNSMEVLKALILQVVWIGIFIVISKVMWNKLIKGLTILGG